MTSTFISSTVENKIGLLSVAVYVHILSTRTVRTFHRQLMHTGSLEKYFNLTEEVNNIIKVIADANGHIT